MNSEVRTIETQISLGLLKQLIEEKLPQLGFTRYDEDAEVEFDWDSPRTKIGEDQIIPIKIKLKQEREVEVIRYNGKKG